MVSSDASLGAVQQDYLWVGCLQVLYSCYNFLSPPPNSTQNRKVLEEQHLLALLKDNKHLFKSNIFKDVQPVDFFPVQ